LQKNPQNTGECAGDFLRVFPLSIDTGGIHVKSSKFFKSKIVGEHL
jgi:hypothetical protein